MRRWLTAGLAALTVAATSQMPAAATGQLKHTCSINTTARFIEVLVNSGHPPQSGSNTSVATIDGTLCGKPFHGAARDVNHFPRLGKFNGVAVIFAPLGSITAKFEGTATLNPDHSATLHGKATITGGTGLYKSATGSNSFTGTQPPNSPITTQHMSGTLTY